VPDTNRDRHDGFDPDRWDAQFIIARDGPRQLEEGVHRRTLASLNNGWLARGGHLRLHDDHFSFTPSPLERLLFAKSMHVPFDQITALERHPAERDAMLPGGVAARMRVYSEERRYDFVFPPGLLDDWIEAARERMTIWERRQRFE